METRFIWMYMSIVVYGTSLWSQEVDNEFLITKTNEIVCLVNDSIIANEKTLEYYKNQIEGLSVIHGEPKKETSHYNLITHGKVFFC